ncbi:MAG: cytochrome c3 family protein [Vicinamibacterales bacterium]
MQLFPAKADALVRLALAGVVGVLVGVPVVLIAWVRTPYVTGQFVPLTQPVAFDHRHHVADDGIDCMYCHVDAERSRHAGVPPTELCLNCHGQIWNTSPALEPVWRSWSTGQPLNWKRVTDLPDFVYFDHAIHTRKGVGCESCHGRVDRMARVYQVAPLTMGWCLGCHRDPEPHLRPLDAVALMGYQPPERQEILGPRLAATYRVRRVTACTGCHR